MMGAAAGWVEADTAPRNDEPNAAYPKVKESNKRNAER
jgi:hypothetical protein